MSNSWELGDFAQCSWHQSNLLPVHTAGTAGDSALNLTVTATTTDAAGAVTAITFSVAGAPGADANMIKQHDRLRFNDGVAGQTNLRYLTFVGHKVSQNPVQFRATADAASTAGSLVTVTVDPPLQVNPTNDQNINTPIAVGHVASVLPSHRAGVIMSGDPLFLAMPRLPDQSPFATAAEYDQDTGCSLRMTHGAKFGLNEMGNVHDGIWGSKLVPEDSMAVIFPL